MSKYVYVLLSLIMGLWVTSASALAPCSSISNYAQLVQAGTCYAGPNNSVTFGNFVTNVSAEKQGQIGVILAQQPGNPNPGQYGLIFNTTTLEMPRISFSFTVLCDASCLINDSLNRLGGNYGSGVFIVDGQPPFYFSGTYSVQPQFIPAVSRVNEYADYTQTAIPNLSANTYEMTVNIIPAGNSGSGNGGSGNAGSGGTCPQ